jgi:hypothetical protein
MEALLSTPHWIFILLISPFLFWALYIDIGKDMHLYLLVLTFTLGLGIGLFFILYVMVPFNKFIDEKISRFLGVKRKRP